MRTSRTGTSSEGFTLLEALLVVLVISLALGLVLPFFPDLEGRRAASEARILAATIRHLHDRAMTAKETCTLTFDFTEARLRWRGPDGERTAAVPCLAGLETPSRGAISTGQATLVFSPTGMTEPFVVRLSNGGEPLAVRYHPFSGRVRVEGHAQRVHPA